MKFERTLARIHLNDKLQLRVKRMMEHQGTKTIETERLLLRQFHMDDAEAMFRNWQSDVKVTEFLRWKTAIDICEAEQVLHEWVQGYEHRDFYQWAIVLKEIGEPIGSISAVEKNDNFDMVHIGYCIGSKWWNQGITSEAFKVIILFFFEKVGANRIEAQHDPNNPGSGKVMQKCGLRYEGTLRQADWSNKGIVDACMYSLLRSEWENGRYTPTYGPDSI